MLAITMHSQFLIIYRCCVILDKQGKAQIKQKQTKKSYGRKFSNDELTWFFVGSIDTKFKYPLVRRTQHLGVLLDVILNLKYHIVANKKQQNIASLILLKFYIFNVECQSLCFFIVQSKTNWSTNCKVVLFRPPFLSSIFHKWYWALSLKLQPTYRYL